MNPSLPPPLEPASAPIDPHRWDNGFARLPDDFFTRLEPTPLPAPYLVGFSPAAAALIGLDPAIRHDSAFVESFAGNRPLPGSDPLAAVYSGHQFGVYVPQLGDGRALLLGALRGADGPAWELQLKGCGQTPYSRMGDGRAVLRSSIREFLVSEAMAGLGIPTTRALCVIGSAAPVLRETVETAAVVTRMSPSFVRFGSFEYFFWRKKYDALQCLIDYTIDSFFPDCRADPQPCVALLAEVTRRTARLMAQWQGVGFMHGVMNSDNMSILGLTMDYGPFAFMDAFDAERICNHSDQHGRYAYRMQPQVAHWNLHCLGQALVPCIGELEATQAVLDRFPDLFEREMAAVYRAKLGLLQEQEQDAELIAALLDLLQSEGIDWTSFWRRLAKLPTQASPSAVPPQAPGAEVRDLFVERAAFDAWAEVYQARLRAEGSQDTERAARMNRVNPKYVLRNHLAEVAIRQARGDAGERSFDEIERLLDCLRDPFAEQPRFESYAALPPDWAATLELSCSS